MNSKELGLSSCQPQSGLGTWRNDFRLIFSNVTLSCNFIQILQQAGSVNSVAASSVRTSLYFY